jgi:hypothetical protein
MGQPMQAKVLPTIAADGVDDARGLQRAQATKGLAPISMPIHPSIAGHGHAARAADGDGVFVVPLILFFLVPKRAFVPVGIEGAVWN